MKSTRRADKKGDIIHGTRSLNTTKEHLKSNDF